MKPQSLFAAAQDAASPAWSFGARKPNAALPGLQGGPTVAARRRAKIWELGATLHCSIVGTCLMSGELRSALRRCGAAVERGATDHELHQIAVSAAGRHDDTSKEIQKTLDQRHKAVIARFAGAPGAEELGRLWSDAVHGGDIPGAYWALLTHPLSDHELVHRAFGDVHMLSHLVGAANRVAIQKLHRLEGERAALEDTLARQQERLRDAFVTRDATIRELNAALSAKVGREAAGGLSSDPAALSHVVADLRKQLDLELLRRERSEAKLREAAATLSARERDLTALKLENAALREESAAAESALAGLAGAGESGIPPCRDLAGAAVLYVGGRPRQAAQMRLLVERSGGRFLHHDGGVEEHTELLPGLVSRADFALFPVDCVSHAAALSLKRLCRQTGKPFIPLRSSGITTFLHALETLDIRQAVSD